MLPAGVLTWSCPCGRYTVTVRGPDSVAQGLLDELTLRHAQTCEVYGVFVPGDEARPEQADT